MSTLEKAIRIASQAHLGQKDKAGAPYIMHPLRVMLKMGTEAEMIAAVLHDLIEDTPWTLQRLRRNGFSTDVLDAIDHLTRRTGETYGQFIVRVKGNPLAVKIKLADLEDNMDTSRLKKITARDRARLEKYRRARKQLEWND